jgi:hypothetical protein
VPTLTPGYGIPTYISSLYKKISAYYSLVKFEATKFGLQAILGTLWHSLFWIIFSYKFSVIPKNHKLQGELSFIWNKVVSKMLGWFFSLKLNLPLCFNLELSHVALSPLLLLSHVLPCFPNMELSLLFLVIFRHLCLTHMKSNIGNYCCFEFNTTGI